MRHNIMHIPATGQPTATPFLKEGTGNAELRLDCITSATPIASLCSSAVVLCLRRRVMVRCSASAGITWLPRKTIARRAHLVDQLQPRETAPTT